MFQKLCPPWFPIEYIEQLKVLPGLQLRFISHFVQNSESFSLLANALLDVR